ncbi:SCO family protein [Paracoccus indicus]|uniref:SCO family protein n=1 Tax=Paracoccus indicus TaxID=2079229 RepID=UPI000D3DB10A|nr:SCO family protein [Paracoccus indicus]
MIRHLALILATALPAAAQSPGIVTQSATGLPDAPVIDQFGNRTRFRDAVGDQIFVLNFTYTRCPELCGMADLYLTDIDERRDELDRPVRLVTLTLDPARDRPDDLLERHRDFGSPRDWLRLTGEPSQILPLLRRLGAWDGGPLEDHKLFVIVGDGQGRHMTRLEADPWLPERIFQIASDLAQHAE